MGFSFILEKSCQADAELWCAVKVPQQARGTLPSGTGAATALVGPRSQSALGRVSNAYIAGKVCSIGNTGDSAITFTFIKWRRSHFYIVCESSWDP